MSLEEVVPHGALTTLNAAAFEIHAPVAGTAAAPCLRSPALRFIVHGSRSTLQDAGCLTTHALGFDNFVVHSAAPAPVQLNAGRS